MDIIESRMQDWTAAVFELDARMCQWGDLKEPANDYAVDLAGSLPQLEGESEEEWDARGDALVAADPHWQELVAPSEKFWSEEVEPSSARSGSAYLALVSTLEQEAGMTEEQARVFLDLAERMGRRWAQGLRLAQLDAPQLIMEKQAEMVSRSLWGLLEAA